mmetsp:Transcript_2519/g.3109  ORF Transcript_2519/g.3109 Transcript_2519/m.3109 type:complete len:347 (+) Transcript_2519:291-1331(+)
MHATCHFTSSIEPGNGLAILAHHCAVLINLQATHAVVNHRRNNGAVKWLSLHLGSVDEVVEKLLAHSRLARSFIPRLARGVGLEGAAVGVLLLLLGRLEVSLVGGFQGAQGDAHVFAQLLTVVVELHDTAAGVVLAVPDDLIGRRLVQDQPVRRLGLPHLTGHVVASAQLVAEPVAVAVDHQAAHAAQGLGRQELDLGLGVVRLNEAGGMDLHPLQVNGRSTNGFAHLDGVTCAVLTVGGGQVQQVRAVRGQQGVGTEVGTKTARSQNHGAKLLHHLTSLAIFAAHHTAAILHQLEDLSLGDDPGAVGLLGHLLQHLDQGICDGHPWEALLSTVRAWLGVSAQSSH